MYEFIKNRVCRCGINFCCTLCNVKLIDKENVHTHITSDERHLEQMKTAVSFKNLKIDNQKSIEIVNNGIIAASNRNFKCMLCSCSIPKLDHIPEHINGKKHLTKRRKMLLSTFSEDSFDDQDKINENSVHNNSSELNNELFYCNKCQDNLESDSSLLYHRMFHLSQKYLNITDIISFSMKECTKSIHCLICDYTMKNEDSLHKHLKEVFHKKRLDILYCSNNDTIFNMMYLNSICHENNFIAPNLNNFYNTLNVEFNRYLNYLGCNTYNNQFPIQLQYDEINNKFKEFHRHNENKSPIKVQGNTYVPIYFCFICNMKFKDESLLYLHYNYDYIHKYRMKSVIFILNDKNMKFTTYSNNEVIECLKCQIQLTELKQAVTHMFEIQHLIEQDKNEMVLTNDIDILNNDNSSRNIYTCPICKINVTHDYLMVEHLESKYHRNKIQDYYANINCESFQKIIFFCPNCKMNFFNDRTLLEHFYLNHQNGFKSVINNSCDNGTIDQRLSLNQMNSALNDLIKLNLNQNHHKKLKAGINTQDNKSISKSLFHKNKTLVNFSPRYVKLKSIEKGEENIFKIDSEGIRKLELGIRLTFPYNLNRGCIPCRYEISNDLQLLYEHLRTEEHENNLQKMEENHKFFEKYHNQFSDLELAKSYMCESSDEWVNCLACDINIKNCDENLHSHINSESHIENYEPWKKSADKIFKLFNNIFENLWYYIETYFCNLCYAQFNYEVDYAKHLENRKHLKKLENAVFKTQSLQFDCCILCSSFWFAKSNYHTIHCKKASHTYILTSRDFTVPEMTDSAKRFLESIEETIDKLVIESNENKSEKECIEKNILESVEKIIKSKYPAAKAYLFGSRISHISVLNSDFDIFLDCENNYKTVKTKIEQQEQILIVQECFHKHQDIWIPEEVILSSRVPIIKLRHRHTNLNCDISFSSGLSVEESKILGYYTKACLPCKQLILYIRKWGDLCGLSGIKGIKTFAYSWLVIFYLQIRKILPSVQYLIKLENNSNMVAGWEIGVSKTIPVETTNDSIEDFVRGFFSYYAEFNYISDVVCPFLGKVMKKSNFSNIDDLPNEMSYFKAQIQKQKVKFFRLDSPMCIQGPIDLSQNIAIAVTKLRLRMFKQYCAESALSLRT